MTIQPDALSGDEGFNLMALRQQDGAEFERMYLAFAPRLRVYLWRLSGDTELTQDLLQETFVKAYRGLPRTSPDLKLKPWLYKIATHCARSALRTTRWKQVLPFSAQPKAENCASDISLESRYADAELVERALAALKPEYSSALLLHWREGFEIEELSQILGLNREALKKRLYRAKLTFVAAYNRECARVEGDQK